MIYRRLDSNGEYSFGRNSQDFISETDAVAQAVQTRLNLLKGEWWEDADDGLPLFQNILGSSGSNQNIRVIDNIIKKRINETAGVLSIDSFVSSYNSEIRAYNYQATITTIYSTTTTISGVI